MKRLNEAGSFDYPPSDPPGRPRHRSAMRTEVPATLKPESRPDPEPPVPVKAVRRAKHAAPDIETMLTRDDIARVYNISLSTVDRHLRKGWLPQPDKFLGQGSRRSPRWKPSTIQRDIDGKRRRNGG